MYAINTYNAITKFNVDWKAECDQIIRHTQPKRNIEIKKYRKKKLKTNKSQYPVSPNQVQDSWMQVNTDTNANIFSSRLWELSIPYHSLCKYNLHEYLFVNYANYLAYFLFQIDENGVNRVKRTKEQCWL